MFPVQNFRLSLPSEEHFVGKPRLNRYTRLMARFYEAYFLLCSLNQTREGHTEYPSSSSAQQGLRREYMRSLAFICDGKKGGDMFTAFSVAEVDATYVFFLASKSPRKCKLMLERSIHMLVEYAVTAGKRKKEVLREFLNLCIEHARKRISAYLADLKEAIPLCIYQMSSQRSPQNDGFVSWLKSLLTPHCDVDPSHLDVCVAMHRASMSCQMRTLHDEEELEKKRYADQEVSGDRSGCFTKARHSLGRLAARIQKPLSLLLNAPLLQDVLQRAEVRVVKQSLSAPKPDMDSHTTLPGILRRMFPKDDPDIVRAKQALVDLQDTECKPLTRYMEVERGCTPFVHSEICVLEYFYKWNLKFLEGDRYVYCSKPACYICKLYFTEHPASMIVPESHGKVYPNWGPPLMENFKKKDADSDRQRDLMIEITKAVRKEVVNHLWGRSVPQAWHPDSTTGVSNLAPSLQELAEEIFGDRDEETFIVNPSDSGFASSAEGLLHDLDHVSDEGSASSQGSHELKSKEFHDESNSDEEGGALL